MNKVGFEAGEAGGVSTLGGVKTAGVANIQGDADVGAGGGGIFEVTLLEELSTWIWQIAEPHGWKTNESLTAQPMT